MRNVSLVALVFVLLAAGAAGTASAQAVPETIIDFVLHHADDLALSPAQVQALERLDADLARQLIRRQADLALASVDLDVLMDGDPTRTIDVARTEASVRDVERARAELQLVLVQGTEAVKAQLDPEQRTKLAALLDAAAADLPVVPVAARGAAHGGRSGGHPSYRSGRYHPSHHGHSHGHLWIGAPLWWDPFWAYPPAPVIVEPPPVYVQQTPAYWYYCPSLRAYYPSVTTCPEPWVPVPAQ